jgi:hypothetical protein
MYYILFSYDTLYKALKDLKMKIICNQIGNKNSAANFNAILEQSGYKVKEYHDDCFEVFKGVLFQTKKTRVT